jgi:hypothetical protein
MHERSKTQYDSTSAVDEITALLSPMTPLASTLATCKSLVSYVGFAASLVLPNTLLV